MHIQYDALTESSGPYDVIIDDLCDSVKIDNDTAKMIFHRKISIGNKELFEIDVLVESIIRFKRNVNYSDKEYKKFFEKNYIFYYRNTFAASTISLVVGQITGSFGRNPLIVAFKDTNKEENRSIDDKH